MKKVIFMLAVGALGFTACSDTEVVEEGIQSSAIGFTNMVSKNSRAVTADNFNKFKVYGTYKLALAATTLIFNGQEVTKEGDVWSYSPTRYWIKDAIYNFAAFGSDKALTGVSDNYGMKEGGSKYFLNLANVKIDGGQQADIVYANAHNSYIGSENPNENKKVAFDFKHILSKLTFKFVSDLPVGYTATISNPLLHNVRNIGNFEGETEAWNVSTVNRTETVQAIAMPFEGAMEIKKGETEAGNVTITSGDMYVIPYTYKAKNVYFTFSLVVKDSNNSEVYRREGVRAVWAPKWNKGEQYVYTVTINGAAAGLYPIEFSGSVSDWNDGQPGTPDFSIAPEDLPQAPTE